MRRAESATCSSDVRGPAEGAPTRAASAHPITARMIGTAVNAASTKKIRWRKESGIFLEQSRHKPRVRQFDTGVRRMKSHTHYLWFTTKQRQEILDITDEVAAQLAESDIKEGVALVSAMHITASVFVNDHESGLWHDILRWLETSVAPWDPGRYRHNETGED